MGIQGVQWYTRFTKLYRMYKGILGVQDSTGTGNFLRFQSVNKKGYFWVLSGFHLGISQYGKMIPNPPMGQEFSNISPIMGFPCPSISL